MRVRYYKNLIDMWLGMKKGVYPPSFSEECESLFESVTYRRRKSKSV